MTAGFGATGQPDSSPNVQFGRAGIGIVLAEERRRTVLWAGGTPHHHLAGALLMRGCTLRDVDLSADAISDVAPDARALIIELPADTGDALRWAGPSIEMALAHGLAVAFTMPADRAATEVAGAPSDNSAAREGFYDATAEAARRYDGRIRAFFDNWLQVVDWILEGHKPGPGANSVLHLDGDVPEDSRLQTLLRRAFHDLAGISLEVLHGGKSGAGVWIVRPSAADRSRRVAPFLVKWNTLQKTRTEQSYSQYAHDTVTFRLRPPLHSSRCVEDATHGLLVFDFIERAIPFRAALRVYPAGQLIGSLFDHTLAGCLACVEDRIASVAEFYKSIKVLRSSTALREAAAFAAEVGAVADVPDADTLLARLVALPAVSVRVATAHGDLHTDNLLVAAGSSDVLLIDFASIKHGMPVVTDPACLDVSIAFGAPGEDNGEESARPDDKRSNPSADAGWLRCAYRYPLEPSCVPRLDGSEAWIAEAVRAVRSAARQHESAPIPYAVAVACYLLRYASYSDNGSLEDRALAYELACGLALAAENAARAGVIMPDAAYASQTTACVTGAS